VLHPVAGQITSDKAFGQPICRLGLGSALGMALAVDARRPVGFSPPAAPFWYRFVLQHPAVSVTLAAPQTLAELEEGLQVLDATGPLDDAEFDALASHGERVRRHAGRFP
jgi:aryl-alcohol dehydrogenase-like predicted oxidoreductase